MKNIKDFNAYIAEKNACKVTTEEEEKVDGLTKKQKENLPPHLLKAIAKKKGIKLEDVLEEEEEETRKRKKEKLKDNVELGNPKKEKVEEEEEEEEEVSDMKKSRKNSYSKRDKKSK
jgi:hypothetical protein